MEKIDMRIISLVTALTLTAGVFSIPLTLSAAELKIGVIAPFSGGGTDWGVGTQRGVELAIDEINAEGGLVVGGEVYELSAVVYDSEYTAQGGSTAATRLISGDGVKFILGPLGSPPVLATLNVVAPDKAIVLSSGYSPKILTEDSKNNFRVTLTTKEFAPAFIKWLRDGNPEAQRVGIISPNDD